jgi:hypothetical protein
MGRSDVKPELCDKAGQSRRLSLWQIEHQPAQRGRVDDRVLERALEAATHEPRVEGVVAVLDEDCALRETEKSSPGVLEFRGADEHRPIDAMPLAGEGVDGSAAVDERVEKRQRPLEREALGADLEDEERRVAGRLDV